MTATVDAAIASIARGDFAVVADSEDPMSEGNLVVAAGKVSADHIGFMVEYGTGLVCLPMESQRLDDLGVPSLGFEAGESASPAFTVSIDLNDADRPGISNADRAETIRALADPAVTAEHFRIPGHVFPLRATSGGVLARAGHCEAAVDLATFAGLDPAAALCQIADGDSGLMRGDELGRFAERHSIPMVTIGELVAFRWRTEALVSREAEAALPTDHGTFRAVGYRVKDTGTEHIALVLGDVEGRDDVLARAHSACLTGDVFGSLRCDCRAQLSRSMELVAEAGRGVIVYNPTHEGRGTGLADKLAAYQLQERGLDTAEANMKIGHAVDARHYGVDAQILRDLGIASVRLLTNNPTKIDQLRLFGVTVSDRVPLWVGENPHNQFYLETKETRLGHMGKGDTE